ncbi:MAG: hypothetical protein ACYDCL_09485 [Myxococcales bacterium]
MKLLISILASLVLVACQDHDASPPPQPSQPLFRPALQLRRPDLAQRLGALRAPPLPLPPNALRPPIAAPVMAPDGGAVMAPR